MDIDTDNTITQDQFIIAGDISEINSGQELEIKQETQLMSIDKPSYQHEQNAANLDDNNQTISDAPTDHVLAALIENIHQDIKHELDITENELFHEESILPNKGDPEEILGVESMPIVGNSDLIIVSDCTDSEDHEGIKQEHTEQLLVPTECESGLKQELPEPSVSTDGLVPVKNEAAEGYDFYQYPQDDSSMDEYDGSAMGHVEACLNEDSDTYKMEDNGQYNEPEQQGTSEMGMKLEPDISVTETHLISNKLYNTTSTVTRPHDGLIESQTTRTLVMEIRPCTSGDLLKVGTQPDKILSMENSLLKIPDNAFQLNSITGDYLPFGMEAEEVPNEVFACSKCSKICKSISGLHRHAKVHESIERMATSRARARIKSSERHRVKREIKAAEIEKNRCECGNSPCLSKMETKDHSCSTDCRRCIKIKKKKRFSCKFCPTDYETRKDLFRHLSKHKKVQLLEYQAISEVVEGEETLSCFICGVEFDNKVTELEELKAHVMDHTGPHTCRECPETFKTVVSYAAHVTKVHPKLKGKSVTEFLRAFAKLAQSWKCDDCNVNFKDPDGLAQHIASKHKNIKHLPERQCQDCRRVFSSSSGLTSHRRIHHKDKLGEPLLFCVHCRKPCKDQKGLNTHMRLHSEERKFPCRFCDYRFATPERRKIHVEIHTGNMRFVCFICEYRCSSENRLKNHKMSAKHLSMKEYLLNPPVVEEAESEVKDEFKSEDKVKVKSESECDICGERFSSEKKMLVHKKSHPFISFPNEDQPTRIFFK